MLYDLLPLLRGWKYKNIVLIPEGMLSFAGPPPVSPNLLVGINGAVPRGTTIPLDTDKNGWLLSVVFKSSDASCKLTISLDGESYELLHIGAFEPPAPMPFHDLNIEASLDNNSSEQVAIYYAVVNRIIITEMSTFKEGLQKLGIFNLNLLKELQTVAGAKK